MYTSEKGYATILAGEKREHAKTLGNNGNGNDDADSSSSSR